MKRKIATALALLASVGAVSGPLAVTASAGNVNGKVSISS